MNIILETNRLKISIPTIDSFNNRYKLLSDAEISKFIGNGKPKTKSEVKEFLQKNMDHYQKYGFCLFDIFLKNTGEFIGDAGLIFEALNSENKDIEVGYRLLKKHWEKGYATELAEFFIKWGFDNFHFNRIVACCDPDNIASSNVMKKCGMRYQGKHLYNGKNECDIYYINNIVIKTDNFYLQPFHEVDDFKLCYDLWHDKDVIKPMRIDPDDPKEDIKKKLLRYKSFMDKYGFTNFAVFKKDNDEFIGSCGFSIFHDPDGDHNPLPKNKNGYEVELGYLFYKKYWGKGYATELTKSCIDFIFNNYSKINRIVAVTYPANIASQKVLEKIGFEFVSDVNSKEYGKEKFFVIKRKKDAKIELSEHDSSWNLKFEEEKRFLNNVIGKYLHGTIEHIGSTSISGIIAKPVIDIMFGVKSLEDSRTAIELLTENGYSYFPYKKDIMHWFCKPSKEVRTHHLHLVPFESDLWKERIKFRDILKENIKIADEYALLKTKLAKQYKNDREAYTEGKSSFIKRILNESKYSTKIIKISVDGSFL